MEFLKTNHNYKQIGELREHSTRPLSRSVYEVENLNILEKYDPLNMLKSKNKRGQQNSNEALD